MALLSMLASIAVCWLCVATQSASGAHINIVGGYNVTWPLGYIASVRKSYRHTPSCTAVLIAPRHLLTAAVCVKPDISVAAVGWKVSDDDLYERREIRRFIPHPKYNAASSRVFNIAVVELDFPSSRQPVAIRWDNESELYDQPAWVAGLGLTKFGDTSVTPVFKAAKVTLHNTTVCDDKIVFDSPETMLCAGGDGDGFCWGDLGGPLIVRQNRQDRLIGLANAHTIECQAKVPDLYTRLSTLRDFIGPFLTAEANAPLPTKKPRPPKPPIDQ